MRRQRWRPIAGLEEEHNGEMTRLKGLLAAAIVLVVFALGFAIWALFLYNPEGNPAPTPTKTARPATPTAQSAAATATRVPPSATPRPTQTAAPSPTAPAPTETAEPSPTPEPTRPPTAAPPKRMQSPEYGMHIFGWWRPEVADRDMGYVRDAGFQWIKQIFAWYDIEGAAKGHYQWERPDRLVAQAENYGLKMLVRVDIAPDWARGGSGPMRDFNDYGDFVYALASRYKGLIDAYQIWNEPNLAREWGGQRPDPAAYAKLLRIAYTRIKQADPNALVVSAGLAPTTATGDIAMPDVEFVRGMYEAGAKPYFDVLGVHGAGFKAPPEADPGEVAVHPVWGNPGDPSAPDLKRVYCFRHVEDVRRVMVEAGDADKQVAVLEFGWTVDPRLDSAYYWHAVSEAEQADYLVRAYQWAAQHWKPWIGLMSLIYIANPDWTEQDEQYWWAVTLPSWPVPKVRQAYNALKAMPK